MGEVVRAGGAVVGGGVMVDLKPWAEVQELLPSLSQEEKAQLRRSIQEGTVNVPVLYLPDGRIIDGHHRWELSDHTYPYLEEVDIPDSQALVLAITLNVARRHMSGEQKKQIADVLRKQLGYTQEDAAAAVQIGRSTLSTWENITNVKSDNGYNPPDIRVKIPKTENPTIYDRHQAGETQEEIAADYKVTQPTIAKRITAEKKQRKKEEERQAMINQPVIDDPTIWHGDFRELGKDIPDNSVDLIFTDPPYDEKNIPLYGDLAELGGRILKPGGSLICYVGHYALPDVLPLMTPHLRFWWTLACIHSGNAARLAGKWVFVEWKPMLWFVKEYRRQLDYVADLIKSKPVDKTVHEWEQSSVEAEYYIEHLTLSDEMVLDPMCGSGTTCLAALKLNRKTLGIEEDVERFRVVQTRITEYRSRNAESQHA